MLRNDLFVLVNIHVVYKKNVLKTLSFLFVIILRDYSEILIDAKTIFAPYLFKGYYRR